MEILGISAIEDRLQDSTADTIATLRAAGIKMWVLTGDMTLTAITIGYSSRLLKPGQQLLKYEVDPFKSDEENRDNFRTRLAVDILLVKDTLDSKKLSTSSAGSVTSKDSASFALVIEGKALHLLLGPMEAKSPHERRVRCVGVERYCNVCAGYKSYIVFISPPSLAFDVGLWTQTVWRQNFLSSHIFVLLSSQLCAIVCLHAV